MYRTLSESIKGLSKLGEAFSKTIRTDSSFSGHDTLAESRRNHDIQPLRYSTKVHRSPQNVETLRPDVKKTKAMGNMKDERILE